MSLTFTNINPADGSPLSRTGPIAFTLSSDVRDGQGVRIGVYMVATDTEETVWNGSVFVGKYTTLCIKSGDDFILRRRGGWPTGGVALRVSEIGSTEIMTIWTDGSGAPSDSVGVDGDYYLRTSNGAVYKRSGGTYSIIFTPSSPLTAAPAVGIGAGNTEGVAATFARSDHDHKLRTGSTDLTIGDIADTQYVARSGTALVGVAAPSSANVIVQEEGSTTTSTATTLNFVGAGVTASGGGSIATITVPGGGTAPIYVTGNTGLGTISAGETAISSFTVDTNSTYQALIWFELDRNSGSSTYSFTLDFNGVFRFCGSYLFVTGAPVSGAGTVYPKATGGLGGGSALGPGATSLVPSGHSAFIHYSGLLQTNGIGTITAVLPTASSNNYTVNYRILLIKAASNVF